MFWAEGTGRAKALRSEHAWHGRGKTEMRYGQSRERKRLRRQCKVCRGQAHQALRATKKDFGFCLQCDKKLAEGFVQAEGAVLPF